MKIAYFATATVIFLASAPAGASPFNVRVPYLETCPQIYRDEACENRNQKQDPVLYQIQHMKTGKSIWSQKETRQNTAAPDPQGKNPGPAVNVSPDVKTE